MSKKKDKKKNKEENEIKNHHGKKWAIWKPKLIRRGIVFLLSLVFAFISLFWIPGELHYVITETYTFASETNTPVYLAVLLPTSGHYQDVSEPDITWEGGWDIRSDGRLEVVLFEVDQEAGETVKAEIQYQVNLFQGQARWVGDPITSDDLTPTKVIQSDHPDITAKAEELKVEGDARATAKKILNFTFQHLAWTQETRINADLSALTALQSGVGGCAEHANLMTALCRAADIPAHTISGLAMPETIPFIPVTTAWNHPAGAHAWVEVFADDLWQMADPSWSEPFYQKPLFGWTDGKHLAYDKAVHAEQVYQSLLTEAEDNGGWIAAMSAPLRFVAWSDADAEQIAFTPEVTLRKTWDARYLMIFSVIVILVVMSWLVAEDRQQNQNKQADLDA